MFGIVTACYSNDYIFAKATCASIKYFMPDVPICVIVDGHLNIQELKDVYNVIELRIDSLENLELRIDSLENLELREILAGSGKAKLAAIWEGHFDEFVYR